MGNLMNNVCRVCDSTSLGEPFIAREMMFGMRDEFKYVTCSDCSSAQIAAVPPDLSRYYPADYYSFSTTGSDRKISLRERIIWKLISSRDMHALGKRSIIGAILCWLKRPSQNLVLFKKLKIKKSARILDVGCGGGALLDVLAAGGYTDLLGADPFIEREITTSRGVKVLKRELQETPGVFDVIMLHHCLEHVGEPSKTLGVIRSKLSPDGVCIIRLPTTSSEAWERYGANWVQLDPPRHLVIPSREGMAIMGDNNGLKLVETIDDSSGFQFWGSEQYLQNISLVRNGITDRLDKPALTISKQKLREFDHLAQDLNRSGRGDQAAFIYKRA